LDPLHIPYIQPGLTPPLARPLYIVSFLLSFICYSYIVTALTFTSTLSFPSKSINIKVAGSRCHHLGISPKNNLR